MTAPLISVRLLDGFELLVDELGVPVTPSSQRLLAYLALHDGTVTRTALAAGLWPGVPERRASACLRSALWRLMKPPHALVDSGQGRLRIGRHVPGGGVFVRRDAAGKADPDPRDAAPP